MLLALWHFSVTFRMNIAIVLESKEIGEAGSRE